jgi:hypothetical protein
MELQIQKSKRRGQVVRTGLIQIMKASVVLKRTYRVVAKYREEARGCFGVCCPVIDGKEHGQIIETFEYTAKKLVSLKAYNKRMKVEMTYRHEMKSCGWKNFNCENLYKERYGDKNWKAELKNAPAMRKYKYVYDYNL